MKIIDIIKEIKTQDENYLNLSLEYVKLEIKNLYKNIAKIHLISAEQAFMSASISNNPEAELRAAIGHLRDAFNAYQVYIDQRKIRWYNKSDVIHDYFTVGEKMVSICCVIALIYEKLEDIDNYISWKNTSTKKFEFYKKYHTDWIADWKDAEISSAFGRNGNWTPMMIQTEPDYELQEEYRKAKKFIDSLEKILKKIV